MKLIKQQGFVANFSALLLVLATIGTSYAQSTDITLSALFDYWEQQYSIQVAYNKTQADTLSVPNQFLKLQPEDAIIKIQNLLGYCHQRVGHQQYLLVRCTPQQWKLQGKIIDSSSLEGLPFASIQDTEQSIFTIADESGTFSLSNINTPAIRLVVHYIGYKSDTVLVTRRDTIMIFKLDPNYYQLKTVQITGLMDVIRSEDHFSTLSLEKEVLKSFPSIMGPDPLTILRLLPGVGGNPESGSGLALRGSKFDQTMLLFDNIQLLHQDHFFGLFSSLNYQSIKDIRIQRSGYSAKYSGFTGGMVRITSKEGNFRHLESGLELDRFTSAAHFFFPLIKNKWSTALTFRIDNSWSGPDRWNDVVIGNLVEQRINASNTGVRGAAGRNAFYFLQDFTFNTMVRTKRGNELSISIQNSQDQVSNDFRFHDPIDQYELDLDFASFWSNTGVALDWKHTVLRNWQASLNVSTSLYFSSTEFNRLFELSGTDTLHNFNIYQQDNTLTQFRLRYDLTKKTGQNSTLFLGIDAPTMASGLDLILQTDTTNFNLEYSIPAIYAEHEWQIEGWQILTGMRTSFDTPVDGPRIEPRISLQRTFGHQWKWRFNYGHYSQYMQQQLPAIREGLVPDYWLLPDGQSSNVISSKMASTGLSYQQLGWSMNLEFYYKHIANIAEQFPALEEIFPTTSNSLVSVVNGNSNIIGSDVLMSYRIPSLTLWGGFDWTNARNNSASISSGSYQPYYTNAIGLRGGAVFKRKRLSMGLNWYWQGGRKLTTVKDAIPLEQIQGGNTSLPAYHRMDASITYDFNIGKVKGTLQNSFFNVYNRKNLKDIRQVESSSGAIKSINSYNLGFLYNLKMTLRF